MIDPIELLKLISEHTNKIFIWSHYYDPETILPDTFFGRKFPESKDITFDGKTYRMHKQVYEYAIHAANFCGGTEMYSYWLERDAILDILNNLGFKNIIVHGEERPHPGGGSAMSLSAWR
jgi:hypothetical protein